MQIAYIFILIILIIIIIIIINNQCQQFKRNQFKRNQFKNGCYAQTWGINDVGYIMDAFPIIESYSYPSYNFNLFNTDVPEFPYNFGNSINTN